MSQLVNGGVLVLRLQTFFQKSKVLYYSVWHDILTNYQSRADF